MEEPTLVRTKEGTTVSVASPFWCVRHDTARGGCITDIRILHGSESRGVEVAIPPLGKWERKLLPFGFYIDSTRATELSGIGRTISTHKSGWMNSQRCVPLSSEATPQAKQVSPRA